MSAMGLLYVVPPTQLNLALESTNRKDRHSIGSRAIHHTPITQAEARAMPGTLYHPIFHTAFVQRAGQMRTGSTDSADCLALFQQHGRDTRGINARQLPLEQVAVLATSLIRAFFRVNRASSQHNGLRAPRLLPRTTHFRWHSNSLPLQKLLKPDQ
jgi:hypothetical protein